MINVKTASIAALSTLAVAVGIGSAQAISDSGMLLAQANAPAETGCAGLKGGDRGARLEALADELNLTDAQRQQLEAIGADARTQAEAVLTEAQIATFRSTLEAGGNFRQAMQSVNLSDDQRSEIRSIFESSRAAAQEVLTEAQQQQFRQIVQERRGSRRGQ